MLWVRPMDSLTAQPLPGTENAIGPFWSPNSRSIGFFADGKLKKIALAGGPPVTLGDALQNGGGAWSREGVILFVPHPIAGIHRVADSGGPAMAVTTIEESPQQRLHFWPSFLPDGRHFLYFVTGTQGEESGIYLGSLDNSERRRILTSTSNAVYAPPGFLLFARENALMVQAFDAGKRRLEGEPLNLTRQIPVLPLDGERKPFSWAQTQFNEFNARFSPDSRWIAWTSDESGTNEIYVRSFQNRNQNSGGKWQISAKGGNHPSWRSDGHEIFYFAPDGKLMAVPVKSETGFEPGTPRALFDLPDYRDLKDNYAVTRDGKKFLLASSIEETKAASFTVVLNWIVGLNR